jgi:hypothetical protein
MRSRTGSPTGYHRWTPDVDAAAGLPRLTYAQRSRTFLVPQFPAKGAISEAQRQLDNARDRRLWVQQPQALRFVDPVAAGAPYTNARFPAVAAPGAPAVLARALWQTPLFDMHSGLAGVGPVAQAVPIVQANGVAVEIRPVGATIAGMTDALNVYALLQTATVQTNRRGYNDRWQDVTQDFYNGNESTLLSFPWPAPSRFWSLTLVFDCYSDPTNLPTLFAQGTVV